MADYREMYRKIFISASKAIEILQKAQQEAEDLYIQASTEKPILLEGKKREVGVENQE